MVPYTSRATQGGCETPSLEILRPQLEAVSLGLQLGGQQQPWPSLSVRPALLSAGGGPR